MTQKISNKHVHNVTWEEHKRLRRLTMGDMGAMRTKLDNEYMRVSSEARAIVVKEDDKPVGWALVWRDPRQKYHRAYFYVKQKERRKGIGTKLIKEVRKVDPAIRVYPWDPRSRRFFEATGTL